MDVPCTTPAPSQARCPTHRLTCLSAVKVDLVYVSFSCVWRGCVMVTAFDSPSRGRGFNSRPFNFHQSFHVTSLGKLFTHITLCASIAKQYNLLLARALMLCCWEGKVGPCESVSLLWEGLRLWDYVACGLTAWRTGSALAPTLARSYPYWTTLPFLSTMSNTLK